MIINQINFNKVHTSTPANIININSLSQTENSADVAYHLQKVSKPAFLGLSPKFIKAKAYLDSVRPEGGFDKFKTDIYSFDLNKLDGIQDGIKVFEGLNVKELAFISKNLTAVNIMRGCYNKCAHCFADAQPPMAESGEFINKMSWEDFKSLTSGFKELYNRLGFHMSGPRMPNDVFDERYLASFHDSDCIDIVIKDKTGTEHDMIDIMRELAESTGIKPLFDTTGWTVANKKLQQRAEKYAQYFSAPKNLENIYKFNISVNPFHALYTRSVMERRAGNIEQAEKFREIYTDRIANAIFTFTPILKNDKLDFIMRAFNREEIGKAGRGFTLEDLEKLGSEIFGKVKQKYLDDLNGEQKYIKTQTQLNSCIKKIKQLMDNQMSEGVSVFTEGRSLQTFGKDNERSRVTRKFISEQNKYISTAKSPKYMTVPYKYGIIDSNGKYYITNFSSTYPTELQLNFANRGKKTAPIKPALQEDLVITKAVINNV